MEELPWSGARGGETSPRVEAPAVRKDCKDTEKEYTAEPVQFLERWSGGWPPIVSREKVVAPIVTREKMEASYV